MFTKTKIYSGRKVGSFPKLYSCGRSLNCRFCSISVGSQHSGPTVAAILALVHRTLFFNRTRPEPESNLDISAFASGRCFLRPGHTAT